MSIQKVVRNGKVAVLISPGYGAGWYSWNTTKPECLFHPEVVAWVEAGKKGSVVELADRLFGKDFYAGGGDQLEIEWVPEGTALRVTEYDGSESLETDSSIDWTIA